MARATSHPTRPTRGEASPSGPRRPVRPAGRQSSPDARPARKAAARPDGKVPSPRASARLETEAVRDYMEALGSVQRHLDPVRLRRRVEGLRSQLERDDLDPLLRLELVQRRMDLERRLAVQPGGELFDAFTEVAAGWAVRNHISFEAFVASGVPIEALAAAGISPSPA